MKYENLKKELLRADLPESIQIDACTNIIDCNRFVSSHLNVLDANRGNKTMRFYYDRLLLFFYTIKKEGYN